MSKGWESKVKIMNVLDDDVIWGLEIWKVEVLFSI